MWGSQHPSIWEARGRGAAQNQVEVYWAGYTVGSGVVLWALGWGPTCEARPGGEGGVCLTIS